MGVCVLINPTPCLDHVRLQFKDTITTPNKSLSVSEVRKLPITGYPNI